MPARIRHRPPEFDLIVVGASFAGLTCARAAALRGLRVLVIDAKREPGHRIHTTGILVKEAAEECDVPARLTRTVHGVRLYAPNLAHVDLHSRGNYFLTTDTARLMRWLAGEAERAGARFRFGARFTGASRDRQRIRLHGLGVSCGYLIGADGARSRVAEAFGLSRNTRFLVGVEAEYRRLAGVDEAFLHCFIDSRIAPGYLSWIAPGPDVIQVGTAVHRRRKPNLDRFRTATAGLFAYDEADVVERRSGLIPCGGLLPAFAAPGVMLIGDAAGMVSPLTAGGIQLAFRFGRRAGQLVADHLLHFGPPPEQVMTGELPGMAAKLALRRLLDLRPPNGLVNALLATAPMSHLARSVYFHDRRLDPVSLEEHERALAARGPNRRRAVGP